MGILKIDKIKYFNLYLFFYFSSFFYCLCFFLFTNEHDF